MVDKKERWSTLLSWMVLPFALKISCQRTAGMDNMRRKSVWKSDKLEEDIDQTVGGDAVQKLLFPPSGVTD
jgi:hypothetical protein